MQVSQTEDHVTHAVIGGGKTIELAVANSAEFMLMMSSTLYTNQILAVVREVLCNAWDAHIDANCTDKPIVVTLTHEKFTVKDFGKGIPKDMIGPIYGTYGGSTKKNDGNQTGGFGLGCKAPFAYTDHFEVTSAFGGEKTIYNMSKSSAQVGGKPGIIPLASFPSAETGLTVSIPLKSHAMRDFGNYVRHVVANGEMNVVFNGDILPTHPFSTMTEDFLTCVAGGFAGDVNVRYGNVIYPIPAHPDIAHDLDRVSRLVRSMNSAANHNNVIVFQAPADSISVTPSREALSMQTHTIKTLQNMLKAFTDRLDKYKNGYQIAFMKRSIEDVASAGKTGLLFNPRQCIPMVGSIKITNLHAVAQIVELIASRECPNFNDFNFKNLNTRADALEKLGTFNRGLLQSYRANLRSMAHQHMDSRYTKTDWFHRQISGPLIAAISSQKSVTVDRLFVYGHLERTAYFHEGVGGDFKDGLVNITKASQLTITAYLRYLRNVVVISHTKLGIQDTLKKLPKFKVADWETSGFLLYTVYRSKDRVDEAVKFFTERGMDVINITGEQTVVRSVNKPSTSSKTKGLPCISNMLQGGVIVAVGNCYKQSAARISDPKWITRIPKEGSYDARQCSLERYGAENTEAIVKLFGDSGAGFNSVVQEKKYKEKGAVSLANYMIDKVCAEIVSNPRITTYYKHLVGSDADFQMQCYEVPALCLEFGLVNELTANDRLYIRLFKMLIYTYSNYRGNIDPSAQPALAKAVDQIKSIKPTPESVLLAKAISDSKLLKLLNVSELTAELNRSSNNPSEVASIMAILRIALN